MGKTPPTPSKQPFAKPALTPRALLLKLRDHGLHIEDESKAIRYLSFVGHFRLKGYWYPLQDATTKQFAAGTTFSHICQRYECDREIRTLIMEAVERLEVAARCAIGNFLSLKYSPHWYLDPTVFKPTRRQRLGAILAKIEAEVERANGRLYVASYYDNHDEPYLPPSWAMTECVTLGLWSKIFAILRDPADKKAISSRFGITQVEVFESWLHTLTVLRNMAAHHDRFLGASIGVSPTNLKVKKIVFKDSKSVYASLTVINVLLSAINFEDDFKSRLTTIESKYGEALFHTMGFPEGWKSTAIGW